MEKRQYKNLIFFTNGSIGDFLMVLFFMENVHKNNTHTRLVVATPRNKNIFTELSRSYDFLTIEEIGGRNLKSIMHLFGFLGTTWFRKNLVITPPTFGVLPLRTKITAKLLALWRGSDLVGFYDASMPALNKILYDHPYSFNTDIFYFEMMQKLLADTGFQTVEKTLHLPLVSDTYILSKYNLKENSFVVIHPTGAVPKRSIGKDELIELIQKIFAVSTELSVIISGSREDRVRFERIQNQFPSGRVILLCGELSITELMTLMQRSRLFIGVDTGPTHIASFLGVKSIVIAHYGTPNWLPYYNPHARILYALEGCTHTIHEGKEHLNECRAGRVFPLVRVPCEVVEKALQEEFSN